MCFWKCQFRYSILDLDLQLKLGLNHDLKYDFNLYFDHYLNPQVDLGIDHDPNLHILNDLDFEFDINHPLNFDLRLEMVFDIYIGICRASEQLREAVKRVAGQVGGWLAVF